MIYPAANAQRFTAPGQNGDHGDWSAAGRGRAAAGRSAGHGAGGVRGRGRPVPGRASLSPASRRVYLISLTSWAWALVGRPAPRGAERRGAVPPVVPLAVLDQPESGVRLAAALAGRGLSTDARTVNRELSALRSAVGWWQDQGWISPDPTAGLRNVARDGSTGAPAHRRPGRRPVPGPRRAARAGVLAGSVRLGGARGRGAQPERGPRGPARPGAPQVGAERDWIRWGDAAGQLLGWLLAGRTCGPVFLTDRRAPARAAAADVCPVTGRARMSYRRAAEIFTAATRPLDPAGRAGPWASCGRPGSALPRPR